MLARSLRGGFSEAAERCPAPSGDGGTGGAAVPAAGWGTEDDARNRSHVVPRGAGQMI